MAKKLFKEKQQYRDRGIITLLVFLIGGMLFKIGREMLYATHPSVLNIVTCTIFIALMGVLLYYLLRLQLNISVSDKSINVKMKSWYTNKKRKIYWDEIESCNIVQTPLATQWHGGNIRFDHEKTFSFCGRNGVELTTKSGEKYFLGSRRLEELKTAIKNGIKNTES